MDFRPQPRQFSTSGIGNIEFTGGVVNPDDPTLTGSFTFVFNPATTGNPRQELKDGSYTTDAGPTSAARPRGIDINLSPLPVPAAVWLFGSAMFTLLGLRRRSEIS